MSNRTFWSLVATLFGVILGVVFTWFTRWPVIGRLLVSLALGLLSVGLLLVQSIDRRLPPNPKTILTGAREVPLGVSAQTLG